jgi:UV DNA damage endonuclease
VRLGFAVKVLGEGGLTSHDARRWQSGPHLWTSLEALRAILDHLALLQLRARLKRETATMRRS